MDLASVKKKLRDLGFTGGNLGKDDFDSTRALAAYSMIDKDGNVVLDSDNLAATLANLVVLTPPTSRAKIADLLLSDPVAVDTEAKAATLMAGISDVSAPDSKWESSSLIPWKPENLEDTVSKLSGPGFAKLRSSLGSQFGIRLQSTGDSAAEETTQIVLQTIGATPQNPFLVTFDQIIDEPFTGGQFDLVERESRRRSYGGASAGGTPILTDPSGVMNWQSGDANKLIQVGTHPGRHFRIVTRQSATQVTLDASITLPSSGLTLTMDGEAEEAIATTSEGFTDGETSGRWSRLKKVITSDKVYKVVFIPGSAGAGSYSLNISGLNGGK
jgi:hypothetical protein